MPLRLVGVADAPAPEPSPLLELLRRIKADDPDRKGEASPGRLAATLGTTKARVRVELDALIHAGLVTSFRYVDSVNYAAI